MGGMFHWTRIAQFAHHSEAQLTEHPPSPLHKGDERLGGREKEGWQESCHPLSSVIQRITRTVARVAAVWGLPLGSVSI